MKRYLKGFYMSLGMFNAFPLPFHIWDDACANLLLPCFPVVGAIIGLVWWGAAEVSAALGLNSVLSAAVITAVPFLMTGFLHLDGYMDTSDAVLSRRPREDKVRILKDPHTGSFAVIMAILLFLLMFAASYTAADRSAKFCLFPVVTVISRCCSAFSMLSMKAMPESGYAKMLKKDIKPAHKIFAVILFLMASAAAVLVSGIFGLIIPAAVTFSFMCALAYSCKEFGGISGDLTGFSLTVSELCGVFAIALMA